jgi:hypothetical protein
VARPDWNEADATGVAETIDKFLTHARDGKADPGVVTDEFKKLVGSSGRDADRAQGYSDEDVGKWLKEKAAPFRGKRTVVLAAATDWAVAEVADENYSALLIRLVKGETPTGWRVDWAHTPATYWGPTSMREAGQRFAITAFADSLFQIQPVRAGKFLTEPFKMSLAPAPDKNGISQPLLAGKLTELRGEYTGYQLMNVEPKGEKAIAHLLFAGRMSRKPVDLTLVPGDKPGTWLIDAWTVK